MSSKSEASIQPITRMTVPMLSVLAALVSGDGWYGLRIAEATAMRTGSVYPILARFERAGWVTSTWEDKQDPAEKSDPGAKRKYYRLTPEGRERALIALRLREEALAKADQTSFTLSRSVFGHLPERTTRPDEPDQQIA
jgi:PadR family transcriptional regulator, regulatory protein PadR